MAGQYPEYEKPGPAKGQAYGAASVTNVLEGAEFPCSKSDLIDVYGDRQIHWTKARPMVLKDILEKVPQDQFQSMADVVQAVGKVSQAAKGQTAKREI